MAKYHITHRPNTLPSSEMTEVIDVDAVEHLDYGDTHYVAFLKIGQHLDVADELVLMLPAPTVCRVEKKGG